MSTSTSQIALQWVTSPFTYFYSAISQSSYVTLTSTLTALIVGGTTLYVTRAYYRDTSSHDNDHPQTPKKKQQVAFPYGFDYEQTYFHLEALARARQASRKAKLYFMGATDEFLLEDHLPELQCLRTYADDFQDCAPEWDSDAMEEAEVETWDAIRRRYQTVTVHYVSEEQMLAGTTRITRSILHGQDKNENALLFLENLDKVKMMRPAIDKYQPGLDPETSTLSTETPIFNRLYAGNNTNNNGETGSLDLPLNSRLGVDKAKSAYHSDIAGGNNAKYNQTAMSSNGGGRSANGDKMIVDFDQSEPQQKNDEDVLLNINPKQFEKKKDQLFIDFFSMYTKKFVEQQNQPSKASSRTKNIIKLQSCVDARSNSGLAKYSARKQQQLNIQPQQNKPYQTWQRKV